VREAGDVELTMSQPPVASSVSTASHRFYGELARWWPLVSPVEDYADEAGEFYRVLQAAAPNARTLLELGSGGGHNAFHLKRAFQMTLSDLSDEMLAVSRRINPECDHVCGDMRTLDLGRTFDTVFVHDAIDYMTTELDLAAAIETAYRHCRPGGVALFVPDALRGSFEPSTECGGRDGPDGEGIRYLEWSYDPDPDDSVGTTQYTFIIREVDGEVSTFSETHLFGVFPQGTWLTLLARAGFAPEIVTERTDDDRNPRSLFIGHRQR
jgi:SAM-dependent methyltransferase